MLLGTNLFIQGKFKEAKSCFKNIMSINPNNSTKDTIMKFITQCDSQIN